MFFHGDVAGAQAPAVADAATLLEQAQATRTKDHPHFLQLLQQLHLQHQALSSGQQWHLRLLDAWEASFEGDYAKAEPLLRDVAAHADDLDLQSLANGMLLNLLAIHHHYEEAFILAEHLATTLPRLHDRHAIYVVLSQLSQLMASAGQVDPAASYARQMESFRPSGESPCRPYVYLFGALNANDDLAPTDPIFRKTIDACVLANEPLFAETVQLDLARRQADVGDSSAALALLKRIEPSVIAQNYKVHVYVLRGMLGYAYWVSGDAAMAQRWALAALAMDPEGNFDGLSEYVYRVLYEVENKAGHYRVALDYYRHYKDVQFRSVSDTQAIALAYHTVHQQLAIHNLQMSELSKHNRLLELQQALDRKAMEASRLYLVLLLIVLASIGFWLVRLKRSQMRFKKLARRDSLTGILNHQHFVSAAEQALRYTEKSSRSACVVLLDLDHFKHINDTYGHAVGDAVLIKVVAVCRMHLRSIDVFGRLGGEEFGLVLPECSLDDAVDIVQRMRKAIVATTFDEKIPEGTISGSFGLASTSGSGYALSGLMANADAALYRAKDRGRNRVETLESRTEDVEVRPGVVA
ncbi:MAG: GGDEF domain-containing protein [Rhodanobacter sp.]